MERTPSAAGTGRWLMLLGVAALSSALAACDDEVVVLQSPNDPPPAAEDMQAPPPTPQPEPQPQPEPEPPAECLAEFGPFNSTVYNQTIYPLLSSACAGCHEGGEQGLAVYPDAAPGTCEYADTVASMRSQVDLSEPSNSPLYVQVTDPAADHPIQLREDQAATLLAYLRDAACREDGGPDCEPGPPPAVMPSYETFEAIVQPALDEGGCTGCHSAGTAPPLLRAQPQANYNLLIRLVNPEDPFNNTFYTYCNQGHRSGAAGPMMRDAVEAIEAWLRGEPPSADD